VLLALLPATATVVGFLVLAQIPGPAEAVGIAAVVGAVALRSRDGDPPSAVRAGQTTESDPALGDAA
jgi:inner membrane transporter RhtA